MVDAIDDTDLALIADGTRSLKLVSGGSGITVGLARTHFPARGPLDFSSRLQSGEGPVMAISGSMSPATQAQNSWALANGFADVSIDASEIVRGRSDAHAYASGILPLLEKRLPVLVRSDARTPADVQALGQSLGLTDAQTGECIATTMGNIARIVSDACPLRLLIVSGGETSGAVCQAMGVAALETGLPIEPGVPYVFPEDRPDMVMVLKSGNFGGAGFYGRVVAAVGAAPRRR